MADPAATPAPAASVADPAAVGTPPPPPAAGSVPEAAPKMYKVKIDGQETEVDEDTLLRNYQLAGTSHERIRQAAERMQQVTRLEEEFGKDPVGVLRRLAKIQNVNLRESVEKYLIGELDRDKMSASERELERERERRAELEAREKARVEAEIAAKKKAAVANQQTAVQREIMTALEKAKLPTSPDVVRRMAREMLLNERYHIGATTEQIAAMVKQELQTEHKSIFGKMKDDEVLEALGDTAQAIRRAEVAKLQHAPPAVRNTVPGAASPAGGPQKPLSTKEAFKRLTEQFRTQK